MSKFFTSIPVDVEAVRKALPKGACVLNVVYDWVKEEVRVVFDHDPAFSGMDYAIAWPMELLRQGKLPENVSEKAKVKKEKAVEQKETKGTKRGRRK